jgi:hypothetical protein
MYLLNFNFLYNVGYSQPKTQQAEMVAEMVPEMVYSTRPRRQRQVLETKLRSGTGKVLPKLGLLFTESSILYLMYSNGLA